MIWNQVFGESLFSALSQHASRFQRERENFVYVRRWIFLQSQGMTW